MAKSGAFTDTEKRILALLSDGMPHTRDEIRSVLNDNMATNSCLKSHISHIRDKLPAGQRVICELNGRGIQYRHVRLLLDPAE
jgi:DNA-binding CsgD family transcriptional regulator